jgi:hypothetical protein
MENIAHARLATRVQANMLAECPGTDRATVARLTTAPDARFYHLTAAQSAQILREETAAACDVAGLR